MFYSQVLYLAFLNKSSTSSWTLASFRSWPFCFSLSFAAQSRIFHEICPVSNPSDYGWRKNASLLNCFDLLSYKCTLYYSLRQHFPLIQVLFGPFESILPLKSTSKSTNIIPCDRDRYPVLYRRYTWALHPYLLTLHN